METTGKKSQLLTLSVNLRYNVATEDWTELSAKLPHEMFSHAAMFMNDPACPGAASVQNNGGEIKCLGRENCEMSTMFPLRKSHHVDRWTTLGKQRHRLEQSLDK